MCLKTTLFRAPYISPYELENSYKVPLSQMSINFFWPNRSFSFFRFLHLHNMYFEEMQSVEPCIFDRYYRRSRWGVYRQVQYYMFFLCSLSHSHLPSLPLTFPPTPTTTNFPPYPTTPIQFVIRLNGTLHVNLLATLLKQIFHDHFIFGDAKLLQ